MFQGAFTQDKKGPCYIQKDKTAAEKKACVVALAKMNAKREEEDRY